MWYELLYVEISIIFATEVLLKQTAPHISGRVYYNTCTWIFFKYCLYLISIYAYADEIVNLILYILTNPVNVSCGN
jgi:hypothetical protein